MDSKVAKFLRDGKYTVMAAQGMDDEFLLMKLVAYYCTLYHHALSHADARQRRHPTDIFCSSTLVCATIAGVLSNEWDCEVKDSWYDTYGIDRDSVPEAWAYEHKPHPVQPARTRLLYPV